MSQINELPTEVLQKMGQQSGVDPTRIEPDDQTLVKPTEDLPPETIQAAVKRMEKENGDLGKFNRLVKQRETFHNTVHSVSQQRTSALLKQAAKENRVMLANSLVPRLMGVKQ